MRKLAAVVLFLILNSLTLGSTSLWAASTTQEAPQTARQALMEMFFSKQPGTLLKHLPSVTRAALEKSGALAGMQQYSVLAGQLQAQGRSLQTFEAGPVMLTTDDPKTGQKVEVVVDSDSLQGDQDDIAVSFHTYKDKVAQRTPFMPRVIFSMKMESGLWTLNDIAITIDLPLADPDLLQRISDGMKSRAAAATPQIHVQSMGQAPGQVPTSNFGGDASALAAVRKILTAETTYAATYPAVGYTCTLSDLDGFGAGEANEHQAMLISSGLASGKHQGYNFSLSGCTGAPATSFRLTAAPIGESYGRRTFCSDQSGAIRSSSGGNAAACLSGGTPLP
ncbi:MAG: hypothetical protein WCF68_20910 [Terriglobales bacterium]